MSPPLTTVAAPARLDHGADPVSFFQVRPSSRERQTSLKYLRTGGPPMTALSSFTDPPKTYRSPLSDTALSPALPAQPALPVIFCQRFPSLLRHTSLKNADVDTRGGQSGAMGGGGQGLGTTL